MKHYSEREGSLYMNACMHIQETDSVNHQESRLKGEKKAKTNSIKTLKLLKSYNDICVHTCIGESINN